MVTEHRFKFEYNYFFISTRFLSTSNQMKEVMPFIILLALMAHQTPAIPKPSEVKRMAIGILRLLNVMLMMAGGMVRPVP